MSSQKLTELSAATLPLEDTDLFYGVQQVTSTSSSSRAISFIDLTNQIILRGGITVP